MLKLIDEMVEGTVNPIPHDSMTLYDVSCATVGVRFDDNNIGFIYDDAIFRIKTTYGSLVNAGYEVWFDDGNRITRTPPVIDNDTDVIANIIHDENDPAAYKLIVNVNNLDVIPPNYYGNVR